MSESQVVLVVPGFAGYQAARGVEVRAGGLVVRKVARTGHAVIPSPAARRHRHTIASWVIDQAIDIGPRWRAS